MSIVDSLEKRIASHDHPELRHAKLFHALCEQMDLRFHRLGRQINAVEWAPAASYNWRQIPAEASTTERALFILAEGLDHRFNEAERYLSSVGKRARTCGWVMTIAAAVVGALISHWCF